DKTVRVWNAADGAAVRSIDTGAPVTALAVSADNLLAAAAGEDRLIHLFAIADSAAKGSLAGHAQPITAVQFSADNLKLCSVSADQTVRVWDLKLGREMQRFADHKAAATAVSFSADNKTIVSGGADNQLVANVVSLQPM